MFKQIVSKLKLMVELFLSKKHEEVFHVRYSGLVTIEDDKSYWESHLKMFLVEKKNISFITEIINDCIVVDKSFFDKSSMDKLDTLQHLKNMYYITESGIHTGFMNKYINEFPCDYVTHQIYRSLEHYCITTRVPFEEFECVFKFESNINSYHEKEPKTVF
jgi:hypothetical protein